MNKTTFAAFLLTFFMFFNVFGQNDELQFKPRPASYEFYQNFGDTLIVSLRTPNVENSFESKLPYPMIFIHGLNSSSETWNDSFNYYNSQYGWQFGGRFDFCLNADGNNATTNLNFFPTSGADIAAFETTIQNGDYYSVNFNVNTDGSIGSDALSNQSAIYKQGLAVKRAVERVMQITGKNKVILVGHSMGGLASRQYIQNPENWQADNYHHVAKLLTLGTPHGGSNASDSGLGWFAGIDTRSEAIRDLKITYYYSGDQGRFLFGGPEINNSSNMDEHLTGPDFYNIDINCNGILGENIVGLNAKPIDHLIDYSTVIGRITNFFGSNITTDGVVEEPQSRMDTYLTGLTYPTKVFLYNSGYDLLENHTELPGYYYQMMQGLDEPNVRQLAYDVQTNKEYTGFTTIQSPVGADNDFFKFTVDNTYDATVNVTSIVTSSMNATILDSAGNPVGASQNNSGSTIDFTRVLTAGDYFLRIVSTNPTNTNYQTPYRFTINTTLATPTNAFAELMYYPNPVKDILHLDNISLSKVSVFSVLGQLVAEKNFDSTTNSIDLSQLNSGIYLVVLESENQQQTIKIIKE